MEIFLWSVIVLLCFVIAWQTVNTRKEKQLNLQLKADFKKLTSRLQKAEQASEAKSRYLSGITHELRAPLNVIMGYAQLLEQQSPDSHPDHDKFTLMRQNCEHLSHIIEGLLEFSAMGAGKLKVQSDTFNLPDLLTQLEQSFHNPASQKKLTFDCQWADNIPTWVKTDRKRLQQILINLLSNAIKFTDKGSVSFHVSYRSQVVTFKVKDTGLGISHDDLERIFTPFERLGKSNQNVPGTGLGLPISRLLSDLLGAELSVKSESQKGSEFTLKIMLSAQTEAATQTTELSTPKHTNKYRILVVDDEVAHGQLMLDLLSSLGFEASTVTQAGEALSFLNEHQADLCILDINMPDCDGWTLAERIRENGFKAPIVMLSGNARDQAPSGQIHHQAYLSKPIKIDQLKQCVSQLLKTQAHQTTPITATIALHKTSAYQLSDSNQKKLQRLISIGHINGIEAHIKNMYADGQLNQQAYQHIMQAVSSYNIQSIKDLFSNESTGHE